MIHCTHRNSYGMGSNQPPGGETCFSTSAGPQVFCSYWEMGLGHDAVPYGKPDPTGSRVGRADPILVSVRPTRLQARPAKCVIISSNSCHRRVPKLCQCLLYGLSERPFLGPWIM